METTLAVRAMRAAAVALLVAAGQAGFSGASHAAPVYFDPGTNLEWRQVKETVGYSYNQINTGGVNGCSAATGVCSGLILGAGPSLEGWTWATEALVRRLFHELSGALDIPGFNALPSGPHDYTEGNSTWAPAIIDTDGGGIDAGIFDATFVAVHQTYIFGWTRTTAQQNFAYVPFVLDNAAISDSDQAGTDGLFTISNSDPTLGIWLVREASVVPAPGTLLLLATGVAALGWRRRSCALSSYDNSQQRT